MVSWSFVNSLSWILVTLGSLLSIVANLNYTRSLIESRYFGSTLDGFGMLNRGHNVRSDDPEFEDTVWFLDEYGYMDDLNGDKSDIESVSRAFNKVYVRYENDNTEDLIPDLERSSDRIFNFVNREVDSVLNRVIRIGVAIFVLGVVSKILYYGRDTIEMAIGSILL